MNPITKAHIEGVELFKKTFFVENGEMTPETYVAAESFLTTYGTNLLKAAKEAGPGERKTIDELQVTFAAPEYERSDEEGQLRMIDAKRNRVIGHNSCRTSFISAIDEGIKEIKKGDV